MKVIEKYILYKVDKFTGNEQQHLYRCPFTIVLCTSQKTDIVFFYILQAISKMLKIQS